jgi:tRNA A37 methylthiotransferase MiaB
MKIALETLGCKLNQAETEALARQLVDAGYQLVQHAAEAVNAAAESRRLHYRRGLLRPAG